MSQLLIHLETHNLLEPFQSAYRKSHSTETALLRVVNDLLMASDRGHVSILSLLDLSAAFDTIDHGILLQRLQYTFGCTGTALGWFESYLTNRTQSVVIGPHQSSPSVLKYGVPQGSVLGPVLFVLYTQPLGGVMKQADVSYQRFADDSQLHDSDSPSNFPELTSSVQNCIGDVSEWMVDNKLKMNNEKTELIVTGTKHKLSQIPVSTMLISDCHLSFSPSVKNLGIFLDQTLSTETQINQLCKVIYFQLRRLAKIRSFLTTEAANKLAVSLILSRLDYCNSVLSGLPQEKLCRLQWIQNHAARIMLRRSKRDSAVPLLRTLHWLPVRARIEYKVACLCHQSLHNKDFPSYLSELIQPYHPPRALRSQDSFLLSVPRFSLNSYGKRSFSVFGPTLWNSLPLSLRTRQSLPTFKKHLKPHLFQQHLAS